MKEPRLQKDHATEDTGTNARAAKDAASSTQPAGSSSDSGRPSAAGRKRSRTPKDGPKIDAGDGESRRRAAIILEVLGGVLQPAEAAALIGISLPAYFHLERRALEGLVKGCQPASRGRKSSAPEKEVARLNKEVKRLRQESARYQALARAARGAAGISSAQVTKARSKAGRKKKRKARPTVRALKVARNLKQAASSEPEKQNES